MDQPFSTWELVKYLITIMGSLIVILSGKYIRDQEKHRNELSAKVDKISNDQAMLTIQITQMIHDVSTIKGQKEGVSLAVLDGIELLRKESETRENKMLDVISNKFPDYEKRLTIINTSLESAKKNIIIISNRIKNYAKKTV